MKEFRSKEGTICVKEMNHLPTVDFQVPCCFSGVYEPNTNTIFHRDFYFDWICWEHNMNIEQNPGGFSVVRHTLCKHFYCIFDIYIYYSDFISCVQGHPKLCFSKKNWAHVEWMRWVHWELSVKVLNLKTCFFVLKLRHKNNSRNVIFLMIVRNRFNSSIWNWAETRHDIQKHANMFSYMR